MRPVKKLFYIFLTLLICAELSAGRKRYDERGNLISNDAAATPAENASIQPAIPNGAPATDVRETATTQKEQAPQQAASQENSEEAEAAEAARSVKNPPTKVFLENGELFHRSNRTERTFENLKKSQEAGEDDFSREAKIKALGLRARRGESGLEAEADGYDDKLRVKAYLAIADGYQTCAREQIKKNDCLQSAERLLAYIGELQPRSREGVLARLRLGLLLLETGQHEAALPHLTRTLMNDAKVAQSYELPLDRAYFMLGQLYERPWYHKDGHKAEVAYRQVLRFGNSPYAAAARERLQYLARFSTGSPRP